MGKIRTREAFWGDTEEELGLLELPGFFRSGLGEAVKGASYVRGACDALDGPSSAPRLVQVVSEGLENVAFGTLGFAGGVSAREMLDAYVEGYQRALQIQDQIEL